MMLNKRDLPIEALAARTLKSRIVVDPMQTRCDDLMANIKAGDTQLFNETRRDPSTWPKHARGVGLMEAPRGALAHWVVFE